MRLPLRVLAMIGVVSIAVVAAVVIDRSFRMPVRSATPAAGSVSVPEDGGQTRGQAGAEDPGEDVVARALRLAAIDSTRKDLWVDDIPDLALAALAPAQRETFVRIANGRRCGCGCGFTLAGCRRFDSECETSGPRALALYDSVRAGHITSARAFRPRPAGR